MASDDEAGPSEKRIKLVTSDPVIDVRSINKLFPKIDNLEHFPLKVLMNIFTRLDYMDLYNLAEKSARFEGIAKIVLKERYSHEYFVVDEIEHKKETYIDFFERFGNAIKAIEARDSLTIRTADQWITQLLDKAKNLEKLILEGFCFGGLHRNVNRTTFQHVSGNITELIFCSCFNLTGNIVPHRFRSLRKLEMQNGANIEFDTLTEIIRYNSALESLVLSENFDLKDISKNYNEIGLRYPFDQLLKHIGTHLKHLREFEYKPISKWLESEVQTIQSSDPIIDRFVNSLKHLDTLGLSSNLNIYTDFNGLLRRLSSECKSIKQLKLYDIDGGDNELSDIIRSFENIDCLALSFTEFGDEIEYLVEHLPYLRELDIAMIAEDFVDWSFVLVLLRKCSSLEKLTVAGDSDDGEIRYYSIS